jgi:methylmalonyl-CoA mutase
MSKSTFAPDTSYNPAGTEEWKAEAIKALKGKEWDTLEKQSSDGIAVHPLYFDCPEVFSLATKPQDFKGTWDIRQTVGFIDAKTANKTALKDLENGVNSIEFVGTDAKSDFVTLLENIHYDLASFALDNADVATAAALLAAVPANKQKGALLVLNLKADDKSIALFKANKDTFTNSSFFTADAASLDADKTRAEQVAHAILEGIKALKAGEEQGVSPQAIANSLLFKINVNQENVVEIAKLRALRSLWAKVCAKAGIDATMSVHAYTSKAMMTETDPYSNVLRNSVAVFAAAIGGANIITTLPHEIGKEDDFSRRLARNTQIVLANESHIGRVNDPAGGAYGFETLTGEIAKSAWKLVQEAGI